MKPKKHQKEEGFTLIELLVVISIMGLMASIILAVTAAARSNARDSQRLETMYQLKTALDSYLTQYGKYPDNEQDITDPTALATFPWLARWDLSSTGSFIPSLVSSGLTVQAAKDPSSPSYYYLYIDTQPRSADTYSPALAAEGWCSTTVNLKAILAFYLEAPQKRTDVQQCSPYYGGPPYLYCNCLTY